MLGTITSLQVWPSGRGYEYYGDIDGPPEHRKLRVRNFSDPPGEWEPGTEEQWREIRRSVLAEMYADRDVLCCDSALVTHLIEGEARVSGYCEGFSYEDIRNLYPDPSNWDLERCEDWLTEHTGHPRAHAENDETLDDYLDELRQEIRDHAEPAEVMEWWRVSSWLCEQLDKIGEVTIDNGYGHWWGRQATGQGYIMDGTLQQVADLFLG